MMAGGFASALMFISMLILLVMLGFFILLHAAQAFFTTIEQTAAGSEEVTFPDETLIDWFGKPFYLAFLLGIYVVPAYFLGRIAAAGMNPKIAPFVPWAAVLVALWFVVPVGLLSVMSSTRWVPVRWAIVAQLFRQPVEWLIYFALNGLILAAAVGLVGTVVFKDRAFLAVVAGPGVAGLWLVYARLLGRLGRLLKPPEPPEEDEDEEETEGNRGPTLPQAVVSDPWAQPAPTSEDEYLANRVPREEAYEIQSAPPAEAARSTAAPREEAYEVGPAPAPSEEAPRRRRGRRRPGKPAQADDENELGPPRHPVKPPTLDMLWLGVFGYPWSRGCVRAWIWMSVGLTFWLFVFQVARNALPE
jgi:hypothetical protein